MPHAMGSLHKQVRKHLWTNPEDCSLTEHEQALATDLDPDTDLVIRGDIGGGKTFTARHHLNRNGIPFKYFSANQLLQSGEETLALGRVQAAQTVVVDNFDVIPAQRDPLQRLHEKVELHLSGPGRSVWLLLPTDFKNEWFETCLGGFQKLSIETGAINNIHADHVYQNIRSIIDRPVPDRNLDAASLSQWGYHAVITAIQ
jgi:hypothetical protein